MKIFLSVLVLIFSLQSWTKADNIKELEIENMTIGDSLLKYFTKKQILSAVENGFNYPKSNEFITILIPVQKGNYDNFQFAIKPNDKNYIIYSIEGEIDYQNNVEKCLDKQKIILQELKNLFTNINQKSNNSPHTLDEKSYTWETYYIFNDGSQIGVFCYDWSKKMFLKNGWRDTLKVVIDSKDFVHFLTYEAY